MNHMENATNPIYFTITGTQFYYGSEGLKEGMKVYLEKEPDNKHDKEAIQVKMPGLGKIGYVANSPHTVIGESYSAGRLYDKLEGDEWGEILYVMGAGVLCEVKREKEKQ